MKLVLLYPLMLLVSLYGAQAYAWSDTDNDGVPDLKDACPATATNTRVRANGCDKTQINDAPVIGETFCLKRVDGSHYPSGCQSLTPLNVYFDLGKVDINFDQVPNLTRLVHFLKRNSAKICIVGHSDKSGSQLANNNISLVRAKNIKQLLIEDYSFDANRFSVRGLGSKAAEAMQEKQIGHSDRRVEFLVE